jgi:hypothetical protein
MHPQTPPPLKIAAKQMNILMLVAQIQAFFICQRVSGNTIQ